MRHSVYIAVLLCVLPASTVLADDAFGRLFTTQEQRTVLDELRAREKAGEPASVVETENTEQAEPPSDYFFNGYIKQNGQTKKVWVEKKGKILKSVDFTPKGKSKVDFNFPEGDVTLKPGQVFSPSKNKVNEKYKQQESTAPK